MSTKATPNSHRIDRSVESRTQFQITLPLSGVFTSSFASPSGDAETPLDQRGWSSPHGEPYRPLGRPNLSLKFSPRLADGSSLLQNAHRMKVFEGKDDRDKKAVAGAEVRHAQPVAGAPPASSGLFDMFPLNFVNKKKPLDERQVKLAHRLHASMSHYSPDKVRGLRRTLPSPVCEPGAESDSPRSHHGADATSVGLLRHAIHECSSRLRAVKNGAGFLSQVPSSEHVDLLVLQEEYHRERAQFVSSHDSLSLHGGAGGARAATGPRGGLKSSHPLHFQSDSSSFNSTSHSLGTELFGSTHIDDEDEANLYLPYTTRRAQQSPTKRHPTLTEFKSKLREEKMPRPLLSTQATATNSASADSAGLPSSSSRASIRASRLGASVVASNGHHQRSPDKAAESASPPSSAVASSSPASPTPGRRASVVFVASPTNGGGDGALQQPGAASDLTPVTLRVAKRTPKSQAQQKKPHSVERLQAAVNAIEGAKAAHAAQLARTVESLNQNRRDCLAVKFQHLNLQHHLDDDLRQMCAVSETQRVGTIDESVERSAWYRDLLKLLLSRDVPLHPAESLLVRAIRRLTNDGHAFDTELLFRVVLLLHRDDLRVVEVQQDLTFLRQALRVSLDDWGAFFNANGLPDPAEIADLKALKQEKLHTRFAKLRASVTLNRAVRNFSSSSSGGRERDHQST